MRMLLLSILFVPATALGLDYANHTLLYTDAPFLPAEGAGISLLTSLGAIKGNPDGTFMPRRGLNRAEFVKIALASAPGIRVSKSDAANCFPDVRRDDWFSPYVCLAKKRGMVSGYQDRRFRPENPVNYAEALKILGELYEYTAYSNPDAPWYDFYVQAAKNHKVILPISMPYDRYLTRGQMARLAAAYRAEYEQELELYRLAERGESVIAFRASQEAEIGEDAGDAKDAEEANDANIENVDNVVDIEIQEDEIEIPTTSHLLLTGVKTPPIADFTLFTRDTPVRMRNAKIVLDREARTLESLSIETIDGHELAELTLDIRDTDDETWFVDLGLNEDGKVLPARRGTPLVVYGRIKEVGKGGYSLDRIKIKSILIGVVDDKNPTDSYQLVPSAAHFPVHQTARGVIAKVKNALQENAEMQDGRIMLAKYAFIGGGDEVENMQLQDIAFHVYADRDVRVSGWTLRATGVSGAHSCSTSGSDNPYQYVVNCLAIPEEMAVFDANGRRTVELYGDIDLDFASKGATLRVQIENPGGLTKGAGDVRWTDGQGEYNWMDVESIDEGRTFTKK